jgi:hypothetical protein
MADDKKCGRGDEVRAVAQVGPDAHLFVRHKEGCGREVGVLRPVKEGEPLTSGNVFRLEAKEGDPGVYRVRDDVAIPNPGGSGSSGKGHSGAATDAYRSGWEGIFGKPTVGEA